MAEKAEHYYKQGLHLVHTGRLTEAVQVFTKAIQVDANFAPAYHNRGETYMLLNRIVEGNTDIQRAKDIRSGKCRNRKPEKTVKLNLQEIDSIYDTVFPEDTRESENPPLEFETVFTIMFFRMMRLKPRKHGLDLSTLPLNRIFSRQF